MRVFLVSCLASLGCVLAPVAFAGSADAPAVPHAIVSRAVVAGECPASITAERYGPERLQTVQGAPASGANQAGQGLRIAMDASGGHRVVAADVVARAFSLRARFLPAASRDQPDVSRVFRLVSTTPSAPFQAHLWMSDVGTIAWLDVTKLRYADGSVWQATKGAACRVYPSGFMPVSGAH